MNYRITKRSIHNFMSDSIAARKLSKAFLPAVGVAVFFLLLHRVEASNKFWIATSPGNFGDDSNWSLSSGGPPNTSAPGASDVAVFDGAGLGNCTIAASISVQGINVASGYSGAITVTSGITPTVGGNGFSQSAGTFNGGSGDIDVNGSFLLTGTGVFNSTTGTLFLGSSFDHNTSSNPGGTFNHNNGTVTFDGALGNINSELSGTVFNNVNFDHTDQRAVNGRSGGGPTITVLGALALNDGKLFSNQIEARGALTISPNFDGAPFNHTTLVIANGSSSRTITFGVGTNMLNVILNDPSTTIQTSGSGTLNWQALTLQGGTINQGNVDFVFPPNGPGNYIQSGGTFNASGNSIAFQSEFNQSGGTFNGGSGAIDVNGGFLLKGTGVFNSTTGTLFIGSSFDHNTSSNPGGTFNHNNGTVTFDGILGGINSELSGTVLNNVNFDHTDQRIVNPRSGGGPTITVLGALALNDGKLFGNQIEARGALTISPNFDSAPVNHATLVIANGSSSRTITLAVGTNMLNVILNDPNATIQTSGSGTLNWQALTLQAGTINQGNVDFVFPPNGPGDYIQSGGVFNASSNPIAFQSSFNQSGGTFNGGSGDIDVGLAFTLSGAGVFTSTSGTLFLGSFYGHESGGTFNHNGGTAIFDQSGFGSINLGPAGETFNTLAFNLPDSGQRTLFGGPLIALGTLSLNNGTIFGGTLQPQGQMTIANTFDGGNGTSVRFSGSNNQSFTNDGGANPSGSWTINKPTGTVTLFSNLILGTTQPLNVNSGGLNMGSAFNLTAGAITIDANGALINFGTGDLTLGGNLTNNMGGTVNFNGGGALCGDSEKIQIRTSISGSALFWFGSGAFSMADVDVMDQNAAGVPGGITAFSSINSGNNTNWNFPGSGCTTLVELVSFKATTYDEATLIEWQTGFEVDNLGFNIYRDHNGKRTLANSQLVAGSALLVGSNTELRSGNSYAWWDHEIADCGLRNGDCGSAVYWLEDVDLNGQSTWHGPFYSQRLAVSPASPVPNAKTLAQLASTEEETLPVESQTSPPAGSTSAAHLRPIAESRDTIKLQVKRGAWYQVTGQELIAAGIYPDLDPHNLQLIVDGKQQAIKVTGEQDSKLDADDTIEFFGEGIDSPFTDLRTYYLEAGKSAGRRISTVRSPAQPSPGGSFQCTVERRDRVVYFAALRNGDQENFFGAVIAGQPVSQAVAVRHLAALDGVATIRVGLQGVTNVEHLVTVSLSGETLGQLVFQGQAREEASFSIPPSQLREGDNQITLASHGGPSDVSLVDNIQITYPRLFTAEGDVLRTIAPAGGQLTITGFTSPEIHVFDVTDPAAVQELIGYVDKDTTGRFSVSLVVSGGARQRSLLALTRERGSPVSAIVKDDVSTLRTGHPGADLVIISRREMLAALDPLINHRRQQGLSASIVDVEDVYDEFSFGLKTPYALREFFAFAASHWKKKPRFVLLAGDASYDPKNYLGFGARDLVPTKLLDTAFMETASDDWLVDFDGDGVGDLAVGRLPVRTAEETSLIVSKIIASEKDSPPQELMLVADENDFFDFEATNHQLGSLVPATIKVTRVNRGRVDREEAKRILLDGIQRGQKLVNYTGHGSVNQWRGNLLTGAEARSLINEQLPLFVMMTCLNGYFQDASLDSLAESLLKAEHGGAVAVWASSGMTPPHHQGLLNQHFYRGLFERGRRATLGEAIMRAKALVGDSDIRRTWILFGDPTSKLK